MSLWNGVVLSNLLRLCHRAKTPKGWDQMEGWDGMIWGCGTVNTHRKEIACPREMEDGSVGWGVERDGIVEMEGLV